MSRWYAVLAVALLAGCSRDGSPPQVSAPATITVTSTVFAPDGKIPVAHTCRGGAEPIPLRLANVPAAARELVVTMLDPDAPGRTFTHWVVYAVPPATTSLLAGVVPDAAVGGQAYRPPCPPGSSSHRYVVTVYALSEASKLPPGRGATAVVNAVRSTVIAQGSLTGRFP